MSFGAPKPTVGCDFDGVLNSYVTPFKVEAVIPDPPVPGAIDWLYEITREFQLVIFTNRASSPGGVVAVMNWLTLHGFSGVPYRVTDVKPVAVIYVDDRGWHFTGPGSFPTPAEIRAFRPWNYAEQRPARPPSPPATAPEYAAALADRAAFAEPYLTLAVGTAVTTAGGALSGLETRLKAEDHVAGKLAALVAQDGSTLAVAAADVKDTVRYTAVFPAPVYAKAVAATLALLARAGFTVERLRNYWPPDADASGRDTAGTYVGVNVVLAARDGLLFELQFHTPESLADQALNWDSYRALRKGELVPADRALAVARMRSTASQVPVPPGALALRVSPAGSVVAAAAPARRAPVRAAGHNEVLRAATARSLELEPKLVELLAPVLAAAGRRAARAFRARATDHLAASGLALLASAPVANSTMICVKPRPDQAAAIADPDGEAPETLHVTLAYLGEVDGPLEPIAEALRAVGASHAPLSGVVGGYGQFDPPGVGILLPDVPGLVELRVDVTEALLAARIDYGRDHGFEAHITVDSDPEPGEAEEMLARAAGAPLNFDELLVVRGDTEVVRVPLVGAPPLTAAAAKQQVEVTQAAQAAQEAQAAAAAAVSDAKVNLALAQAAYDQALATGDAKTIANAAAVVSEAQAALAAAQRRLLAANPPPDPGAPAPGSPAPVPGQRVRGVTKQVSDAIDKIVPADRQEVADAVRQRLSNGEAGDIIGKVAKDLHVSRGTVVQIAIEDGLSSELARADGDIERIAARVAPDWRPPAPGEVLDPGQVAREVRAVTDPVMQTVVRNVAGDALGRVGISFDASNPHIAGVLGRVGSQITNIAATTQADVMKAIDDSYALGLSIPDTAHEIQVALEGASRTRATLIARTELTGATNGASLAATRIVGDVTGTAYSKTWMTAPGAAFPRHETYDGLDGQTVALDETFDVGGEALSYPGDPDGDVAEVANCRCSLSYVDASGNEVGDQVSADDAGDSTPTPPADLSVPAHPTLDPNAPAAKDPILGITPFRTGDDPTGFYDSAKAKRFEADVNSTAASHNVQVSSSRHVTGLWEGQTEPSYSIHVTGSPSDVAAYTEELRARYNQDGALIFTPKKDFAPGQAVNSLQYRISGIDPLKAVAALPQHGLPGGTLIGHQVEIVGGPEDREKVAAAAQQLGGKVSSRVGHVEMLERPQ